VSRSDLIRPAIITEHRSDRPGLVCQPCPAQDARKAEGRPTSPYLEIENVVDAPTLADRGGPDAHGQSGLTLCGD
jgi:hypothetical protein